MKPSPGPQLARNYSLRRLLAVAALALCWCSSAFAQANGKLQIHYMDVGQGDGAVLISPLGEVVLFDDGVLNQCAKPVAYLNALGITRSTSPATTTLITSAARRRFCRCFPCERRRMTAAAATRPPPTPRMSTRLVPSGSPR